MTQPQWEREHAPDWSSLFDPIRDGPPPLDPLGSVEASDQIVDALMDLDRRPETLVRWPFEDLDKLTGPMAPGDVWFVCARSGGGKTTFVCSSILRWVAAGKRLYVLPLETRPKSFRTYIACMQAGVAPGDALSGQLRATTEGQLARKTLERLLTEQVNEPMLSRLYVSPVPEINADTLVTAFEEAKDLKSDIILIDHIDHVQASQRGNDLYGQSVAVNKRLLKLAQKYETLVVATSQLNLNVAHGDALTRYQPPRDQDVYLGNFKRTICTGMVGLYRPLRAMKPGEDRETFTELLRQARKGAISPQEALEPDTMGVIAMKLRNYGSRENERCFLAVENGQAKPMDERHRFSSRGGF